MVENSHRNSLSFFVLSLNSRLSKDGVGISVQCRAGDASAGLWEQDGHELAGLGRQLLLQHHGTSGEAPSIPTQLHIWTLYNMCIYCTVVHVYESFPNSNIITHTHIIIMYKLSHACTQTRTPPLHYIATSGPAGVDSVQGAPGGLDTSRLHSRALSEPGGKGNQQTNSTVPTSC